MVTKTVVVVNKGGDLKDVSFKDFDISNLYKKCGFRKKDGFELRHKYERVKVNSEKIDIHVFSRTNGKSGTENKYDMPPPIDKDLFFGNFALVKWDRDEEDYVDFSSDDWKKAYNRLFKGFEDLSITAEDDANESDELEDISPSMKTKQGYLKDGFVVDSNEDSEDDNDDDDDDDGEDDEDEDDGAKDDEEDDEDEEGVTIDNESWNDDDDEDDDDEDSLDLDEELGSELEEEDFIYSDEED
tara:strand:+ start:1960 stop:2685 length:726 start_codon:yes stop_codon:yes gene_type:complete